VRIFSGVNDSIASAFESTNIGYLLGAAAMLAVGAGLLSTISKGGSSAPSIKETQQELGKFLN
jgi:hypothetical protein